LAKKNSIELDTSLVRRILPSAATGKAAWLAAGATSTDPRTRTDTANLLIVPYVLLTGNLEGLYPARAAIASGAPFRITATLAMTKFGLWPLGFRELVYHAWRFWALEPRRDAA
jgi:hypothetical protein